MLFENYSLSSSTLSFKNDMRHSKKCTKKPKPICLFNRIYNDKNTKYNVDIMMVICIKQHLRNIWSRAYSRKKRHDWEFSEKGQQRARCIKFENIFEKWLRHAWDHRMHETARICPVWSSIHETVKQHWSWVEKMCSLKKKACISLETFLWKIKEFLTHYMKK